MTLVVSEYVIVFPISWREQEFLTGWMKKMRKEKPKRQTRRRKRMRIVSPIMPVPRERSFALIVQGGPIKSEQLQNYQ